MLERFTIAVNLLMITKMAALFFSNTIDLSATRQITKVVLLDG